MLTLQELQTKLDALNHQLQQSATDYVKAKDALAQQLANHNALEGAVMLTRQMVEEEKVKEGYIEPVPAEEIPVS
jgi:septal ring factor EnvC (AmiA/AmiB activator)